MRYLSVILVFLSFLSSSGTTLADIRLPSMGEASSAVISLDQERRLGQEWLRSYRAQTDINKDYLLQEYVENLVFRMAQHSDIVDKRPDIIIVNNPTLNAFAVPGGIIGVNTGLFTYAETEGQFSSVMAHELSHLSQRHFARSVAESQSNQIATMAGILAGILLAATTSGDAGLAMISASQAASLESGLRYSRQNEQEADRIGLQVMANAGYDPSSMGAMFENMLRSTGYVGFQAPEYLRSHPLTESRVNDALNRARQYQQRFYPESPLYQLMRKRIEVQQSGLPAQAVRKFEAELESDNTAINKYGLALAYKKAIRFEEASELARELYESDMSNQAFGLLYADLLNLTGNTQKSEEIIRSYLQRRPDSYALNMALASTLSHAGKFSESANILRNQTRLRSNDPAVWYEYAETLGLAGEILDLHKARAEYFMLVGAYDRAIRQLQFAKTEAAGNSIEIAILDEKITRAAQLRNSSQF
ncbi:MAG: M48 family metalloprotease [Porticoccaceae bacterium]